MPLTLDDVFSQPAAVDMLRRAYLADRLPHGLLFAGPVGVGKATTARALATLFLCERPKGDKPCGKCESCRGMEADGHPDFHVITRTLIRYHDKTGTSKGLSLAIDVIRAEMVEKASRKSVIGVGKVFVVEEAETMNPQAQNAMLKTLEEPAGRTLIILLTDQPGVLLATIRSRTQLVRFAPLPQDVVVRELTGRGISAADAKRAAGLSDGSLGLALKWIEDGVIAPAGELTGMVDRLFAGHPPRDLPAWFKNAAEAYAVKQIERDKLGSKDAATREGLALYLRVAAEHVRRSMPSVGEDAERLEQACAVVDAIARAEQYLDENVNVSLIFQQFAAALEQRAVAVR